MGGLNLKIFSWRKNFCNKHRWRKFHFLVGISIASPDKGLLIQSTSGCGFQYLFPCFLSFEQISSYYKTPNTINALFNYLGCVFRQALVKNGAMVRYQAVFRPGKTPVDWKLRPERPKVVNTKHVSYNGLTERTAHKPKIGKFSRKIKKKSFPETFLHFCISISV